MDTNLPAAVSPFDEAFAGPQEPSYQNRDQIIRTADDGAGKTVLYDMDNPQAWIKSDVAVEFGPRE